MTIAQAAQLRVGDVVTHKGTYSTHHRVVIAGIYPRHNAEPAVMIRSHKSPGTYDWLAWVRFIELVHPVLLHLPPGA